MDLVSICGELKVDLHRSALVWELYLLSVCTCIPMYGPTPYVQAYTTVHMRVHMWVC